MKTVGRTQQNPINKPDPLRTAYEPKMTAPTIPDDYMTLINRDYVYEFASDTYCSLLGKDTGDVINAPAITVWGDEIFYETIKKCLDKCFAGEGAKHEGWMEVPGQGRRYYHLFHRPYTNEQGEVTHAAVALCDLTERKNEEEALRKSQSDFRTVLKHMHFGVYSFDMEGRFTFVNDVVVERTGYPREWFEGKSLLDFVRPEERNEVLKHFEASIRGVSVPPYEFSYYASSGEKFWVQVNPTPIWEKGRIVGVLAVLLDTTKRKEYEEALRESDEKYRMLFEDTREAIFITDRKGRLTDANMSFLQLFGYSKEEATGLNAVDMYVNHGDRDACVRAMNEEGFVKDYTLKLKKKDGTPIDCLLTGSARRDGDAAIAAYQGIVHYRDQTGKERTAVGTLPSETRVRAEYETRTAEGSLRAKRLAKERTHGKKQR